MGPGTVDVASLLRRLVSQSKGGPVGVIASTGLRFHV